MTFILYYVYIALTHTTCSYPLIFVWAEMQSITEVQAFQFLALMKDPSDNACENQDSCLNYRSDGGLKGFSLASVCSKDALQQIQQHGMEMFNDQARLPGRCRVHGFLSGLIHTHWSGAEVDQDVCHATLRQFESDSLNQTNQRHVRFSEISQLMISI